MPLMPPTLRRLASSAGNPLANTVSGCEANDESDYNFKHRAIGVTAVPVAQLVACRHAAGLVRPRQTFVHRCLLG
jgi:hypothetical protein